MTQPFSRIESFFEAENLPSHPKTVAKMYVPKWLCAIYNLKHQYPLFLYKYAF